MSARSADATATDRTPYRLGIDGSNLRAGGGVTHLTELLGAADPLAHGCAGVVVWGGRRLLDQLPVRPWLYPEHVPLLDHSLPARVFWQRALLAREAARTCDLLFVPGGSYGGSFRPFVTMSRNLLPFEPTEEARYGVSRMRARVRVLRPVQVATMRAASGVIFLTETARRIVLRWTGPLRGRTAVIPHGVSGRFRIDPPASPAHDRALPRPFRWLYVSIIDVYKHQGCVAEAGGLLRAEGRALELRFVGPAYAPALRRFRATADRVDRGRTWLRYDGPVPYGDLGKVYREADGFVFASSCENMPNILVESMAAGLPIACSDRGVMPEVLGDAGIYFDPERPPSIAAAMRSLMDDGALRRTCAAKARARAARFTWECCARETLEFLRPMKARHEDAAEAAGAAARR